MQIRSPLAEDGVPAALVPRVRGEQDDAERVGERKPGRRARSGSARAMKDQHQGRRRLFSIAGWQVDQAVPMSVEAKRVGAAGRRLQNARGEAAGQEFPPGDDHSEALSL